MSAQGYVSVTAVPPPDLKPTLFPYMESGYFQRAIESFPKEGDREPWKLDQNYYVDLKNLWWDRIGGAELVFAKKTVPLHGIKVEASL